MGGQSTCQAPKTEIMLIVEGIVSFLALCCYGAYVLDARAAQQEEQNHRALSIGQEQEVIQGSERGQDGLQGIETSEQRERTATIVDTAVTLRVARSTSLRQQQDEDDQGPLPPSSDPSIQIRISPHPCSPPSLTSTPQAPLLNPSTLSSPPSSSDPPTTCIFCHNKLTAMNALVPPSPRPQQLRPSPTPYPSPRPSPSPFQHPSPPSDPAATQEMLPTPDLPPSPPLPLHPPPPSAPLSSVSSPHTSPPISISTSSLQRQAEQAFSQLSPTNRLPLTVVIIEGVPGQVVGREGPLRDAGRESVVGEDEAGSVMRNVRDVHAEDGVQGSGEAERRNRAMHDEGSQIRPNSRDGLQIGTGSEMVECRGRGERVYSDRKIGEQRRGGRGVAYDDLQAEDPPGQGGGAGMGGGPSSVFIEGAADALAGRARTSTPDKEVDREDGGVGREGMREEDRQESVEEGREGEFLDAVSVLEEVLGGKDEGLRRRECGEGEEGKGEAGQRKEGTMLVLMAGQGSVRREGVGGGKCEEGEGVIFSSEVDVLERSRERRELGEQALLQTAAAVQRWERSCRACLCLSCLLLVPPLLSSLLYYTLQMQTQAGVQSSAEMHTLEERVGSVLASFPELLTGEGDGQVDWKRFAGVRGTGEVGSRAAWEGQAKEGWAIPATPWLVGLGLVLLLCRAAFLCVRQIGARGRRREVGGRRMA